MQENVEKFFALLKEDPELQERLSRDEANYPGSLEIREAVAQAVLLPLARELGLPFELLDLKIYETKQKAMKNQDRPLSREELEAPLEDPCYWLIDHGWDFIPQEKK